MERMHPRLSCMLASWRQGSSPTRPLNFGRHFFDLIPSGPVHFLVQFLHAYDSCRTSMESVTNRYVDFGTIQFCFRPAITYIKHTSLLRMEVSSPSQWSTLQRNLFLTTKLTSP